MEQSKPKFTGRLPVKSLGSYIRRKFKLGSEQGKEKTELLMALKNGCLYIAANMGLEEAELDWTRLDKEHEVEAARRALHGSKRHDVYTSRSRSSRRKR